MKTIGSLFSGYGGLDMGAQMALGPMRTAWVSDIEPGPQAILAERFPDAPNLGDVTEVDWSQVEPVDVLTGGSPCQDLSMAGQRAGMKPGTRSGLWEAMAHAIDQLRPSLVIWENVRGALSAKAYCNMEWSEGCVDKRTTAQRPKAEKDKPLRALGRVLGDLANIGYDARWTTLRAADVGAPHNRARVFVVAYPHSKGLEGDWPSGPHTQQPELERDHLLLPTPDILGDNRKSPAYGNNGNNFYDIIQGNKWGKYAPAIRQWEQVLGRPAPAPTKDGKLSPAFVEWMMGLPQGWVTDVPISRTQQLRALGNGVVPQQAATAISQLLSWA